MNYELLKQKFAKSAKVLTVALAFSLPISTAASSILLGLVLLFWLLSANFRHKFELVRRNPVALVALLFSAIYVLGLTYGGVVDKSSISDILRILLVPVFISLLDQEKWRFYSLYAFIASLAFVLLLSYLLWFNCLPAWSLWRGTPSDPTPFSLHITHSLFMAFGAFVFAVLVFSPNHTKMLLRLAFALVALLMLFNVLFMVQGRTGHVVALALALLFSWRQLRARLLPLWLRIGVPLIILLFFVSAFVTPSSAFHQRFVLLVQEIKIFEENPTAQKSITQRLSWLYNNIDIIQQNPILGVGTGGFAQVYTKHIQGTSFILTDNPHNEYMMIAIQLGCVGLLIFVALFLTQWRMAPFLAEPTMQLVARGLVLTFVVASAVTSTLMDHAEGLLFYWMSGLLFAGLPLEWTLKRRPAFHLALALLNKHRPPPAAGSDIGLATDNKGREK